MASNPKSTVADIVMPGHVFLYVHISKVFYADGHTEGSVDLMRTPDYSRRYL